MNKALRLSILLLSAAAAALAATPPPLLNYQGILRNAAGQRLDGSFDMVFRFYDDADPALPENEILVDSHTATNGSAVAVTGGAFNATLGGGTVTDGSGAGSTTTLAQLFAAFSPVYLEIKVNDEVLGSRLRVVSTAYAMNAGGLEGIASAQFLRSDATDAFTIGTLSFAPGTTLDVDGSLLLDGALHMDGDGSDGMQFIYFADAGSPTAESLSWDDTDVRFEFSHDLAVAGSIRAGSTTLAETPYSVFGSGTPNLTLGSVGDVFVASSLEVGNVIYTRSRIIVGDPTPATTVLYSSFGEAANKDAAEVATANDVYVEGDLEVDATLSLNGDLRIDNDGPDGVQQNIYFFDGASPTAEFLRFDTDQFVLSDDLTFEQASDTIRTISNAASIYIQKDSDNDSLSTFRVFTDGNTIEQMRMNDGDEASTLFDGAVSANGIDYAEAFKTIEPDLAAGEVVSLALGSPHHCARTQRPYDPSVIGVVSARPGYITGMSFDAETAADASLAELRDKARVAKDWAEEERLTGLLQEIVEKTHRPIALLGRLPVRVDGAYGPISAGDRLTSSATPGHAMVMRKPGPSLGIALESFTGSGPGEILAFVQPGWYEPAGIAGDTGGVAPSSSASAASSVALSPHIPEEVDRAPAGLSANRSARASAPGVSESFAVLEPVEEGDVLSASREAAGSLHRARVAGDPAVVGIVSGESGVLVGSGLAAIAPADLEPSTARAPIAIAGTVLCKVDAGYGAIQVGDLLTASPTVGHAMRAMNPAIGSVVAKALEPWPSGTGRIRVLVLSR